MSVRVGVSRRYRHGSYWVSMPLHELVILTLLGWPLLVTFAVVRVAWWAAVLAVRLAHRAWFRWRYHI